MMWIISFSSFMMEIIDVQSFLMRVITVRAPCFKNYYIHMRFVHFRVVLVTVKLTFLVCCVLSPAVCTLCPPIVSVLSHSVTALSL